MLRKLLHEKTWAKALELTGLPVRRRHKNHIKLKIDNDGTIATDTEYLTSDRESGDSDREVEITESYENSSGADAEASSSTKMSRQNAVDSIGPRTISSSGSSWGSNFGYVRYFDTSTDMQFDVPETKIKGDCTKNLFMTDSSKADNMNADLVDYSLQRSSRNNNLNVRNNVQHSDSAENSSFEIRNYMGCEDLVNMDQNMQINNIIHEETDFIPTRRSYPNYSARNDIIPKLWKSTEESYSYEDQCNNNIVMSDLLKVLDPPSPKYDRHYSIGSIIIEPPPMFRNDEEDLKIINVNLNANVPFRKHSLNSDKRIRRSVSRSMVETENKNNNNNHLERMSSQSESSKMRRKCECCNRSLCPSPRSSDSGVAGSCNLASPELNMHGNDSDSHDKASDDLKDSLNNLSQSTLENRKLTLSEIEAATFEEQCRCTSPFGSTARTSCDTSVTSETSFDVKDLSNTNLKSTYVATPPLLSPLIKRTSIRRNIERYVPEIKIKPEVPPRVYRKPSTHIEIPKNVRQPVASQWSTINITERTKPSLHYHMRIYREKQDDDTNRLSRKDISRNCDIYNKENKRKCDRSSVVDQKTRSRSEDMSKSQKGLTEAKTGFVVYRSDLYAHWWMKAKLPITVVTDSDGHERQ
ncbi:uncharacterized protein LOC123669443 isoform X2 [Melitaea cinxia]|uniref:uncharacterized protein LOC123669443 isoform X2 n=1 Tax=Melitaea cinxia TaxID=113334 RepID=UPI001E2707F9|nr:uncharacterized protein LOC123669443 isoform X2 [Melitaea cinxia]